MTRAIAMILIAVSVAGISAPASAASRIGAEAALYDWYKRRCSGKADPKKVAHYEKTLKTADPKELKQFRYLTDRLLEMNVRGTCEDLKLRFK